MVSFKKILLGATVSAMLLSTIGCAPVSGTASFTALSKDITADTKLFKPVGERVTYEECTSMLNLIVTFFMWGSFAPNHESTVAKMLEEYKADVILDAEMTWDNMAIMLYSNQCAVVNGIPAVRVMPGEGGAWGDKKSNWMEGQ